MTFTINLNSFRTKVILTLLIGISAFSILAFTIFNRTMKKRLIESTQGNIEFLNILQSNYYFTIQKHDGKIIRSMLQEIEKDHNILNVYLFDGIGRLRYPEHPPRVSIPPSEIRNMFANPHSVSINSIQKDDRYINRVAIRMENTPSCYSCHLDNQKNLGLIVMDVRDRVTKRFVENAQRFSFYYTILLLASIFALVAYLHYRYIRRSLNQFRSTIGKINDGELHARLTIPGAKELGVLGKDFNEMLDHFERTQVELQLYHKQELQNSQKLATIGEMSARIAHEIRNPITGIGRALDIVIADTPDEHSRQVLEEVQRQANRVEQAISNLLNFSRSLEVRLSEGEINEVIRTMTFFLRHQAFEKKVNFEMELSDDLPLILFDHELIENVLLNLTFNAIKYLPEEGTILYRSWKDESGKGILVSARDNGTGIPEEIREDIFKPFFTTHTKGTGLGLAISKEIIEKHNGRIWFENNDGPGCTFYIFLPVKNGRHSI